MPLASVSLPSVAMPPRVGDELPEVARDVHLIPGIEDLWVQTTGDPRVCIAILDGPVDLSHPAFGGVDLTALPALASDVPGGGLASQHGTHVASVIFGQHNGPVKGIAPRCRGLIVPIFSEAVDGAQVFCSQIDLARAITQAVEYGAHVINISAGQFSPSGGAHPILANVVRDCAKRGVLIVAAAGNQGCECLAIPAAVPSVLAVGAANAQGEPLEFNNWGDAYRLQAVLAPGEQIVGAIPGGGIAAHSGTSYAAPIVSGILGLLLSLQLKRGERPNPALVRSAILESALECDGEEVPNLRRCRIRRLDVPAAVSLIQRGASTMADQVEMQHRLDSMLADGETSATAPARAAPVSQPLAVDSNGGTASAARLPLRSAPERFEDVAPAPKRGSHSTCTCGGGGPAQMVYALGRLGYDFGSEARRDSIKQRMAGVAQPSRGKGRNGNAKAWGEAANPDNPPDLLHYLEQEPWDAASVLWTLNLEASPLYVIRPQGPFAGRAYELLRQFLGEQLSEGVERISVPGVLAGKARLISGHELPVLQPEIRGMYSWTTDALVASLVESSSTRKTASQQGKGQNGKTNGVQNFLERIYYEIPNLGMAPQDRAVNFAATNAYNVQKIYESAIPEGLELDTVEVDRSSVCRPDSDCWDVKLFFFYPERQVQTVRKVYRFTVDVSDVVPVMVGQPKAWCVR